MQYGIDIGTYKRVSNQKIKAEVRTIKKPLKYLGIIMIGFMLSRVMIPVTPGINITPFGIAYLLGVVKKNRKSHMILALIGSILGYCSILNRAEDILMYSVASLVVVFYWLLIDKPKSNTNTLIYFLLILIVYTIVGVVYKSSEASTIVLLSILKIVSVIPIYYILKYSIDCTGEFRTNHLFTTEELISMSILMCLIISGIGSFGLYGVSIRNILALLTVISIAYVSGGAIGAASGVTMGFVIGITGGNGNEIISIYSLCGLIVGVFKETGKLLTVLSYLVVYMIVELYSKGISATGMVEAVVAAFIFILIPKYIFQKASLEINTKEKIEVIEEIQMERVREEFIERLNGLKSLLNSLSVSIMNLSENDKLLLKNKGTALVESLADRVCSDCEMKNKCWNRELHESFSLFSDLISSCKENTCTLPSELNKKCINSNRLMRSTIDVVQNYSTNEAMRIRLMEGRSLIVNHLNSMYQTMGRMITDFNKDIEICVDIDRILRKAFNKADIKYKDVFCYTDTKGRLKIKLNLDESQSEAYCTQYILPVINKLVRIPVSIAEDGCRINPQTGESTIVIEETAKYHVATYGSTATKSGEDYSGDSYIFNKNKDGTYLVALSDGMGSGPEASTESKITVELIERFLQGGFSEETAIAAVNSIMAMKFSEDEKFTTLDLSVIDLYTGDVDFIKVGGVVSFLKRGKEIKIIKSDSLPFGVLDSVEIETVKDNLKHGDIIVTISDGILDNDKKNMSSYTWLEEYLVDSNSNPEILSREILEKAKGKSDGKVCDDMTVVVSKIYSVY